MADIETPQWAYPFQISQGRVVEVEQDSSEDLYCRVNLTLHYKLGQRLALPEFGIPDGTFKLGGLGVDDVVAAVQQWVPDADIEDVVSIMEDGDQTLNIEVNVAEENPE